MSRAGRFVTSIERSWTTVRRLALDWDYNRHPAREDGWIDTVRGKSYAEQWADILQNKRYDVLLADWSALVFEGTDYDGAGDVSYSYYQNPSFALDYNEFLLQVIGLDEVDRRHSFREDYDQYVETCPLREAVLPVRYDYSPALYEQGVHPAGHFHFGLDNEVRVGARRILRPLSFTLWVVRQLYPAYWRRFLCRNDAEELSKQLVSKIPTVPSGYYQKLDKYELYLS